MYFELISEIYRENREICKTNGIVGELQLSH